MCKAYELRGQFHALLPCVISVLFCVEFLVKFFGMLFKDDQVIDLVADIYDPR